MKRLMIFHENNVDKFAVPSLSLLNFAILVGTLVILVSMADSN